MPRTRRRNTALFKTLKSSDVYSRYWLPDRGGCTKPQRSQERSADAEIPTNWATSPIFR